MTDRISGKTYTMPSGVFEMPPRKASFIRETEGRLLDVFGKWGYQEIRTPAMEYMDVMAQGLSQAELDIAFKMVDRLTGRMMVLRSDVTPQVARMAALALKDVPRPLRLSYIMNVYRYPTDAGHPRREMIQAGAELLGLDDPQADAEIVALAVESLRHIGLSGFRVSLGQVNYARGLLDEAQLSPEAEDRLIDAANRKDSSLMNLVLDETGVSPALKGSFLALSEFREWDVSSVDGIEPVNERCAAALENLKEVMNLLTCYNIDRDLLKVDIGELASFRYHTGIVFSGYLSGAGGAVLKGGRYDNLAERFGSPSPATGFAIDILELVEIAAAGASPTHEVSCMLVNRTGDREAGLAVAMELRGMGRKVISLIRDIDDDGLIPYAKAHRVGEILILTGERELEMLDPATGKASSCTLEDLLGK